MISHETPAADLASAAGVAVEEIMRFARGEARPSLLTAARIAVATKGVVSPADYA